MAKVPAEAVEQEKAATTAEPLEEANIVVLLKLQFGVVFKVKTSVPKAVGVPVAVNTMSWAPVPVKVPDAAKVTPLAVVEMLYVPTVVTVAVIVWVTPDTAFPLAKVPAEAVEQEKAATTAVPLELLLLPTQLVQAPF